VRSVSRATLLRGARLSARCGQASAPLACLGHEGFARLCYEVLGVWARCALKRAIVCAQPRWELPPLPPLLTDKSRTIRGGDALVAAAERLGIRARAIVENAPAGASPRALYQIRGRARACAEQATCYILSAIVLGVAGICFADNRDERDLRGYQLAAFELLGPELHGIMQERRVAARQALGAARVACKARAREEKAIRSAAFAQDRRVATTQRAFGQSKEAALRARRAMRVPAGLVRSGVVRTAEIAVEHTLLAWQCARRAEQYAPDELARAYGHH
jgi:hypothetical protein